MTVLAYLPAISLPAVGFAPSLAVTLMQIALWMLVLAALYRNRSLFTVQRAQHETAMWGLVVIPQGERWNVHAANGQLRTLDGPVVIHVFGSKFVRLQQISATNAQYLQIQFVNGRTHILPGPSMVFVDKTTHKEVTLREAVNLTDHEVLVVYREEGAEESEKAAAKGPSDATRGADKKDGVVERFLIRGPCLHVPKNATEWIHEFSWHGSPPADADAVARKYKNALRFKKLRVCPDQTYYDVEGVRTKDDALVTVKLMIFYRVRDIDTMLRETHDPIADFINAVSSDVIEFVAGKSFEGFKGATDQLNDLCVYRQLTSRAASIGFEMTKVVFRGYGAPQRLQRMHDDAIERRTKLALERETEDQAQQLEDLKLEREEQRLRKRWLLENETEEHNRELRKAAHEATLQEQREVREASLDHLTRLKRDLGLISNQLGGYLLATEQGPPAKLIQVVGKDIGGNGFVQLHEA